MSDFGCKSTTKNDSHVKIHRKKWIWHVKKWNLHSIEQQFRKQNLCIFAK